MFTGTSLQNTFPLIIICNIIHYFSTPYLMFKNSLGKMKMCIRDRINTGEEAVIQRVKGNEETKRFLENLGFVSGTKVNIVSSIGRCV